jgi:hypothetical protein
MGPEGGDGGTGAGAATPAPATPATPATPGGPAPPATPKPTLARKAGAAPKSARAAAPVGATVPPVAPTHSPLAEQEALNNQLRAAIADAQKLVQDTHDARRLAAARKGMQSQISDEDLLALLPKVDPTTKAGEAAIARWRQERAHLYPAPLTAPRSTPADLQKRLPERLQKSVMFGPAAFAASAAAMRVREVT